MASIISGTEKYGTGKEYYKPDSGDDGEQWASILETFMERIATHTHNGSDSESIVLNIDKFTEDRAGSVVDAIDTKANLDALPRSSGKRYYASDERKVYDDNGSSLVEDLTFNNDTEILFTPSATPGLYESQVIQMQGTLNKDNIMNFYEVSPLLYPKEFFPDIQFESNTSYFITINQSSIDNVKIYYY